MAPDTISKWKVRTDNGHVPTYPMDSPLFTIEFHHGGFFEWGKSRGYPIGYGDGKKGYVDYCNPKELNYLAIVGMAANFGWIDIRYLYFKIVGSEFGNDTLRIEYDSDAKAMGSFKDDNNVVEVYCEAHYNDECDQIGKGSSSDDESDDDEIWIGENEDFSDYIDSDGEEIGKEGDGLVDIGVECDIATYNMAFDNNVDVSILNEGFMDSDHFSEKGGSDSDSDEVLKTPVFSKSDLGNVQLKLGMTFPTAKDFKDAIKEYAIQQGKNIKYKVQAAKKMYLYCANTNEQGVICPWSMYCGGLPGEVTVKIKTYNDKHTCSRTYFNSSVKPRFIAQFFLEMIRINPKWGVKNFRIHMAKALETDVTLSKAYRSLRVAKKWLQGTSGQQYELLWDYCNELKRTNVGSTIEMKVKNNAGPNGESMFESIYICWGALKRGFLEGCRPFLGIDGTHLTGPHRGVLLTAVALDANNCIYPVAYAVVGHETYKTWKWFLMILLKDLNIERAHEYTFISDKQKGLIKAIEKLVPGVEHRFCVWHLYNNFKQKHKGVALKNLLWKAARATTKPNFIAALEEMKALDPAAYEWLSSKPGEHWSKSHFSTHPKCDLLLNNICESLNGALKNTRCKLILEMLEDIRLYLMEFVMQRKVAMEKIQTMTVLCPIIAAKLEMREKRSHEWLVAFNGRTGFEVSGPFLQKFEVDIHHMVCGCNSWQLSGIPCPHAIVALNRQGKNIENYAHLCYSKDVYKKTYSNLLMPINGRELWSKSGKPKLLPPNVVIIVGRPKKARRKGPGEVANTQKLTKFGSVMTCGKCKQPGHNKRTCGREPKKQAKKKAKLSETTTKRLLDESESSDESEGPEPPQPNTTTTTTTTQREDECVREERMSAEVEFTEQRNECERGEREEGEEMGYGDDEKSDEEEGDVQFNTQASCMTQGSENALVDVELQAGPQEKQKNSKVPVRRSSRLQFSPNKRSNVVALVDLTVEDPNDGTMHAGIMKRPEKRPQNLGKGQIYKNGKFTLLQQHFKWPLSMTGLLGRS